MSALEASLGGWSSKLGAIASLGGVAGPGWHTLADLARNARGVADEVAAVCGATTTVGGTFVLARAARAVAEPCLHTLLDAECLPLLRPDAVTVQLNDTGRFQRVAFQATGDGPVNAAVLAAGLVDTFGDFVDSLRRVLPVGRRGLWGLISDSVGGAAVSLAPRHPGALATAEQVLDDLEHLHGSSARPTWILRDDDIELQRGSCCLAFHLDGHGYCETCPVGRRRDEGRRDSQD